MEELPAKLRIDLAMAIHKKMYSNIKFFQDKDNNFIAWVGTFLRPINVQEKDYIYKEGEDITEGKDSIFVLTKFSLLRCDGFSGLCASPL
jgi:hypothetical protein